MAGYNKTVARLYKFLQGAVQSNTGRYNGTVIASTDILVCKVFYYLLLDAPWGVELALRALKDLEKLLYEQTNNSV